ncbi:Dicer-like protein 1 [Metarhizium rileyi]|uniref:Dicer-like protein 1 n=1 Tax=Metarhizium rileyi (strain RCEF 4871) TaxID=1649241 RepID=A0A5C6G539_METRR|nr:Dicer-like protein 1 [Metarhizium rileyi]
MHEASCDSDSSGAIEKYRLTSNPARPEKRQPVQDSEHAAFLSWVASVSYEEDAPTSTSENDVVEGLNKPQDSRTAFSKIITSPRQYQIDLFERAKQQNTIVVLDTGSGKTYIAVLLLRHILALELEHRAAGQPKKVAFFLVDKVALCLQQYRFLRANIEHPVAKFHGDKASVGNQEEWAAQIQEHMVVVCTAQILLDLLGSGLIKMTHINLLVFDEAHHTKKNHPYASIVRDHYIRLKADRPRILGMTASPVDAKTNDFYTTALELEATLCSKIATVSEEALFEGMGKRQQVERVVEYGPLANPADAMTQLCQSLTNLCTYHSNLRSHIEAAKDIWSIIGSWGSDQYWRHIFKITVHANAANDLTEYESGAFHQTARPLDDDEINQRARELVTDHFNKEHTMTADLSGKSSLKVQALHDILQDAFKANRNTRCIVFVQKRYIAFLLSEVFNQSAMKVSNMAPGFVVGSQPSSSSIVNMTIKDQMQALDRFRYGEINCLFATQVAEEGIDVPECDLIVRFDLYDSAIQYIQSKGRARERSSTYINMVEQGNIHHRRKVIQAMRDNNALRRFCSSLPADRKVLEEEEDQLVLEAKSQIEFEVPETGARLTFYSSQQVLAKFVSSICKSADARVEYIVTPTDKGKFIATVLLPPSCPLRSSSSTPQRSKLLARGSAAFKACIELFNRKYIDGNFRPTLTRLLPKMRNARLALSDKKQCEYKMKSKPDMWSSPRCATSRLFVATLSIKGLGPTGRPGRPLCFLTYSALPTIEPLKICMGDGIYSVLEQKRFTAPLILTEEEVESLVQFTFAIFNDVFSKDFVCNRENMPYYLAPCISSYDEKSYDIDDSLNDGKDAIDWAFVKKLEKNETHIDSICSAPVDFENRFIVDPYDGSRKFFTGKVNKNYRAFDKVPKAVPLPRSRSYLRVEQNIAQYSNSLSFHHRQSRSWNGEQPVFDAELLPLRRNLLCEPQPDEDHSSKGCYIILEPLTISTLPIDIVVTALTLPVAIYSIESAAIAMDACGLIDLAVHPPLALEALTQGEENMGMQVGKNYERLEFLGDAFLKMATTVSLFTLIPNNNEFEYHVERMLLVCNKNLFNHAVDRGLQEFVRSRGFDRGSWYPDLVLRKGKERKRVATHRLADKSIADVCEALIGAAYMTEPEGKMDLAVKAVTKMVGSKMHTMTKYSDYYDRYISQDWQVMSPRAIEQVTVAKVEEALGYKFNSPKLLRSAFKHPSYPYEAEIPNYQRLEFLGDALLDLAIVDFLFRKYPSADPQWLTEHKMAMASNHFFSCLCVQLGLHRHVLTTDSSVMGHIAGFVQRLETAKRNSMQFADNIPQANFWLDAEQPPKALSDILEAIVGAMYEDSKYNFDTTRKFFVTFITPYFQDMTLYDTYAAGHPITRLTKLMQDNFCCRSWRLCVSAVPCGSETGASAITESHVICALMIHKRKVAHAIRGNGKDAKIAVAVKMLSQMRDFDRDAFRNAMGCDCGGLIEQDEEKIAPNHADQYT